MNNLAIDTIRRLTRHLRNWVFPLLLWGGAIGCNSAAPKAEPVQDDSPSYHVEAGPGTTLLDEQTTAELRRHVMEQENTQIDSSEIPPVEELQDSPFPSFSGEEIIAEKMQRKKQTLASIRSRLESQLNPAEFDNASDAPTNADMDYSMPIPSQTLAEHHDEVISIDLGQVPIVDVIKTVSEATGINFIWDEQITGTVSVSSPTEMTVGELYPFLESLLDLKGYAAVPAGDVVKVVKRTAAARYNLPVRIGSDPAGIPLTDTPVVQIMPLKHADASEVSAIIRPRLSQEAQMDVHQRTNKLIITDISSNIYHVAKIIQQLDIPEARAETYRIPLEFASAGELSRQINAILDQGPDPTAPRSRTNTTSSVRPPVKVQPDTRTNSLVVTANPSDTERILDLVEQFDVEKPSGLNNNEVIKLTYADAEETAKNLTAALANRGQLEEGEIPPLVTPDKDTNALIVSASPHDFEVIRKMVRELDVVRDLVWVDALIVEVSEDDLQEIGIDWATLDEAVADSVRGFALTNFGPRVDFVSGNTKGISIGAFKDVGGEVQIGAILQALEKDSDVNILSQPSIMTTNHKEAEIVVADNIPVVKDSRVTETDPSTPTVIQTFEYRDVGVKLKITPHTSKGKWVRLDINSEFSKVIEGREGQSVNTPTTAKRTATTTLSMTSGTTVVIGGLIRDDKVSLVQQIPLIGDIPIVGELFKWRREQVQKTNLLIFITPHLLGNPEELIELTQKKQDEIQPKLDARWNEDTDLGQVGQTIWK